jgi:hypothetical protein
MMFNYKLMKNIHFVIEVNGDDSKKLEIDWHLKKVECIKMWRAMVAKV